MRNLIDWNLDTGHGVDRLQDGNKRPYGHILIIHISSVRPTHSYSHIYCPQRTLYPHILFLAFSSGNQPKSIAPQQKS